MMETIRILYDGDCPFCTRYVKLLRLRENLRVELVNARENSADRDAATAKGYDLDHGMLVTYGGQDYYADAAITILSVLATSSGFINRMSAAAFRSPKRAKLLYPVLAFFRRMTVLALGRGLIRNLPPK
jgi:predicted DCC family thiol-disulfide oxidoreductase YuxK